MLFTNLPGLLLRQVRLLENFHNPLIEYEVSDLKTLRNFQ